MKTIKNENLVTLATETTETTTATETTTEKEKEKKKKARTVKEIKTALENNETVTLDEIAKIMRDLKLEYTNAKNIHDNSLYIMRNNKVYLSFNFSKKTSNSFCTKRK